VGSLVVRALHEVPTLLPPREEVVAIGEQRRRVLQVVLDAVADRLA
jgi:hypothetical protein